MRISIKANGITVTTKSDGIAVRWHGDKVANQLTSAQAAALEAKLLSLRPTSQHPYLLFNGRVMDWSGVVQH